MQAVKRFWWRLESNDFFVVFATPVLAAYLSGWGLVSFFIMSVFFLFHAECFPRWMLCPWWVHISSVTFWVTVYWFAIR